MLAAATAQMTAIGKRSRSASWASAGAMLRLRGGPHAARSEQMKRCVRAKERAAHAGSSMRSDDSDGGAGKQPYIHAMKR
jgi:hypothetical protein